jgi:hypothetical protein
MGSTPIAGSMEVSMNCKTHERCLKCRKLNIKRATLQYQKDLATALAGPADSCENIKISPFWLRGLLSQRARIGRMTRNYLNAKRKVRCVSEQLIAEDGLKFLEANFGMLSDETSHLVCLAVEEVRRLKGLIDV